MSSLHHFMIVLMLFSGGLSLWLASIAWRRYPERWALPFTVLMVAFAWWSFGSAIELSVPTVADKLFWLKVQYLAIPAIPFLLLWFCIVYTNRRHWLRWYVAAVLLLIPLTNMQMMWFNWGNLWWQELALSAASSIPTLFITHGPWFSVQLGVAYPAILLGLALLVVEAWRTAEIRRKQALIITGSMLVPTIANMFIVSGEGNVDITPIYFAITGAGIAWGLLRYRLFDVGLTARQLLIDSMEDGMIAVNTENRVVDVNPAVVNLLQRPKYQIVGQPLETLLASQITAVEYDKLRQMRGGELQIKQEETTFYYDVRLSTIGRPPQGTLILLRDVTERKQEAAVVQDMRETMTRAMVHDLRSPISAATMGIDFLREELEESLAAEDLHLLQNMEQNLNRSLKLINEILDISKLESGHMVLDSSPFTLPDLVQHILAEQHITAAAKQITIQTEIPRDLPSVEGDYNLLERVFQNLISNSIKFTPPGGLVRLTAQAKSDDQLLVTIQDSGAGIPTHLRPHLFQKFAKGNQGESGTGLGLAFCKMVLEAHQQRIWLPNTPPTDPSPLTGATFCFTLPLATARLSE
jgi:PAS domain S-box-containing protein